MDKDFIEESILKLSSVMAESVYKKTFKNFYVNDIFHFDNTVSHLLWDSRPFYRAKCSFDNHPEDDLIYSKEFKIYDEDLKILWRNKQINDIIN